MDEQIKDDKKVMDAKLLRRKYWEKESEYMKKSREEFLKGSIKSPMCRKCFYDDFIDGKPKEWKEYCNLKKTRETKDMDRNSKSLNYGRQLGWTYDFECKNGHGTSLSVLLGELEDAKKN